MTQWYNNPYWTEALAEYHDLKAATPKVQLDLVAIEQAIYAGDSFAFRLQDAMANIAKDDDPDALRGVPRVVMALLVRLTELSSEHRGE